MKILTLITSLIISTSIYSQEEQVLWVQGKIINSEGVTNSELWTYDKDKWIQLSERWEDENNYALQFELGYIFIVKFKDDDSERVLYIKATHPDFLEVGLMMDKTDNLMISFIEGEYKIMDAPILKDKNKNN
tara:strand:+ start:1359 stop:1754 length:396 start_codon:yes stop_codon:yes gene_type:complete